MPGRFELRPGHWVDVAFLLLIPLLALFGLFGDAWGTARARTAELSVEMR